MQKKERKAEQAKQTLLNDYKITGKTKLTIVIKSVSSSGMYRRMQVLANDRNISYLVAELCDLPINDKGIGVSGCGMDMTFWLADNITYCLWGKNKPKELTGNGGGCLDWQVV